MATVYINPGHGGKDPGCLKGSLKEKDIVLEVSLETKRILESNGVKVLTNRTTDVYWELPQITNDANKRATMKDLFVSIHVNAGGGKGIGVWHSVGRTPKFSSMIVEEMVKEVGFARYGKDGVWTRVGTSGKDYYHVIRETKMEAVIVELGFIDSTDNAILSQPAKRKAMARALANAIMKYIGVTPSGNDGGMSSTELAKKMVSKGVISDSKMWIDVLDGKKDANGSYVKLIFDRASKLGKLDYDPAYWNKVFSGETVANRNFLRSIFERIVKL